MAKHASRAAAQAASRPRRPRAANSIAHQRLIDLAKRRFAVGTEADTPQRQRELDDLAFYAGGEHQWTKDQKESRAQQPAQGNLPPLPARPMVTINKVRQPVQQVTNNIRQSDFGVEIAAADDFGELTPQPEALTQEIELREGLVRRIQRESEASDARLWAAIRAAIAGRGYYAVLTRFLPGKSWDQEVYVHRFYNQASIMLDPAHEQPDGSDAEWETIGVDMPVDEFEARYGTEDAFSEMSDGEFRALGDEMPGWFTQDKKLRSVRVVDYIYATYTPRTLVLLADGSSHWKDEAPKGVAIVDSREVADRQVKWAKLHGLRVLEEPAWDSPEMPIVKVLGEELQPFDQERRAEGMVRPARDSQVGFNIMVSKFVETIGLTPIPPLVLDPESIESYEKWYQLSSTRALPYLPRRTRDDQGRDYAEPHSPQADRAGVIGALGAAVQLFDEAIQSTTGVPDSRLGKNTDSHLKAARAIQQLQQQSEQGTSNYADNLKRSVRREGVIENSLLYAIYGKRPGRLAKIIDGQGQSQTVMIGAPPNGAMPGAATPPKVYTLSEDFTANVNIKVTKSFDSRREEESSTIAHLLDANPMFMTWFGDLFFENQDGPGHAAMAERAKVMLAPPIQQMLSSKAQGDLPPEVAQQLAAKDQQIQHAEAAMQQLAGEAKSKQAEIASKERIAAADRAQRATDAQLDRRLKLAIAHITASKDTDDSIREAQEEAAAAEMQFTHEAAMAAADAGHDEHMANLAHDQTVAQTAQAQGGQAVLADQGHGQAIEQQETAAALTPPPAGEEA